MHNLHNYCFSSKFFEVRSGCSMQLNINSTENAKICTIRANWKTLFVILREYWLLINGNKWKKLHLLHSVTREFVKGNTKKIKINSSSCMLQGDSWVEIISRRHSLCCILYADSIFKRITTRSHSARCM